MLTHLPPRQNGRNFADDISDAFLGMKIFCFHWNFTDICSEGSNLPEVSISAGNGLAPNRRQAIACTNVDPVHWHIYAAPGGDELTALCLLYLWKAITLTLQVSLDIQDLNWIIVFAFCFSPSSSQCVAIWKLYLNWIIVFAFCCSPSSSQCVAIWKLYWCPVVHDLPSCCTYQCFCICIQ